MANGEYSGTWGTYANQDYYYLEQGVTGVASITLSASTYTLSTAGASTTANAEAYQAVLNFTGTLTGICAVSIPIKPKAYIVRNGTSGGYAITLSAGGSTVTIPYGATSLVFCDSSGLTYAFSGADAFTATTLTSTGNTTVGGNLALTGNVSTALALANNLTTPAAYSVNFGSGQFVKDASGNIQTAAGNSFNLGAGQFVKDASGNIQTAAANTINFGSGQFYKDASGNIGIGTTTPGYLLDVAAAARVQGTFVTSGALSVAGTSTLTGGVTTANFLTVGGALTASAGATFNSSATFNGAVTSAAAQTINFGSGQFYKDSSGQIGVGTASPTSVLQVNGPIATKTPTLLGINTAYTVLATDSTIICDNPGSAVTLTLPDPTTCPGRCLTIGCYTAKNINDSGTNRVIGPGGVVGSVIVPSTSTFATIQASGSVWRVISRT